MENGSSMIQLPTIRNKSQTPPISRDKFQDHIPHLSSELYMATTVLQVPMALTKISSCKCPWRAPLRAPLHAHCAGALLYWASPLTTKTSAPCECSWLSPNFCICSPTIGRTAYISHLSSLRVRFKMFKAAQGQILKR